jgi:hypothetical protein
MRSNCNSTPSLIKSSYSSSAVSKPRIYYVFRKHGEVRIFETDKTYQYRVHESKPDSIRGTFVRIHIRFEFHPMLETGRQMSVYHNATPFCSWISYRHLLIYRSTTAIYLFFLMVYPCFDFQKYNGTSKFPFRALIPPTNRPIKVKIHKATILPVILYWRETWACSTHVRDEKCTQETEGKEEVRDLERNRNWMWRWGLESSGSGRSVGLVNTMWTFGFHKRRGVSWPATRLSTCQEGNTESRGREVNAPDSYTLGPRFKSRPGDRLSLLRFCGVLSLSGRMPG